MSTVKVAVVFAVLLGGTTLATASVAAINLPDCPALAALAGRIVPGQMVPINQTPSRFTIPAAFAEPEMEQLFGLPALDWTQEDVLAAIKLSADCAVQAKKARNKPEIAAFTLVWRSFGSLRATLGAIAATQTRIESGLGLLLADAPSRATLDALMIVGSVRDGSADSMQNAANELKQSSVRLNAWGTVHSHAQLLLKTLGDAPVKSWEPVFPAIDDRVVAVREWVIDDAIAQINATPESVQGLQKLPSLLQQARKELAASLSEADLAGLDAAANRRHEAIEDSLVAQQIVLVDAAPANATGLDQLRTIQQSRERAVLSPKRATGLDARLADRREAIGATVTDEQIRRLDEFPDSMAGLRELEEFSYSTTRGLEALAGPAAATRFRDAATSRANSIGAEAFGPFREALAQLPPTEDGLRELDNSLNQIKGTVERLDASTASRYIEEAVTQRERIVASIRREDARLARLPLGEGAVFVDSEIGARLEFRNSRRVYLTIFGETTESEFEMDGDRMIIRLPGGNRVFTREGPWIRGSELNFKRQSDT